MNGQIPDNLAPFQYEPRFTAEEIQRRREQLQDEVQNVVAEVDHNDDRNRILQQRLEGELAVERWCDCNNCDVPQNPTRQMCECCHEHTALDEKLEDYNCITEHPDFAPVCLTPAVLHMVVNSLKEVRGYGPGGDGWTNRLYRHVSYRAYTYWIHQRLGRYNRRATPACVVLTIRANFPEENDESYISFKEADEVGDAWHL
ncbi:uncharacterized protein [Amphiura filiformis]|uniref:uncharacterized protein n=1 Tax=Amphiura filiformis TaxID=82378 RepID=UPI003B2143BC